MSTKSVTTSNSKTTSFITAQTKLDSTISIYNTYNSNNIIPGLKQNKNKKWQINYNDFKAIRTDENTAIIDLKNYMINKCQDKQIKQ